MSNILFCDSETTGQDPDKHDIIDICLMHFKDGNLQSQFNAKFGTKGLVDLGALAINKAKLLDLRNISDGPYDKDKLSAQRLVDYLVGLPQDKADPLLFGGHNIAFDLAFLKQLLLKNNVNGLDRLFSYRVIDTSTIGEFLRQAGIIELDRMSLTNLAKAVSIEVNSDKTHGASYDCELTSKVYFKMLELVKNIKFNSNNYEALCTLEEETRHIPKV